MLFTQKIQLNLTEEQEKLLSSQSKICNWLYNKFLEIEQTAYKISGNYLGYFNHNRSFSAFKNENPFLKVVHSQVLKETLRRLHKAYEKFFADNKKGHKTGRPSFRSWKRKWMSLVYPAGAGISLSNPSDPSLRSGQDLKITFGKDAEGKQLHIIVLLREPLKSNSFGQVVITKEENGNYYACFALEVKDPKEKEILVERAVALPRLKVIAIDPNHTNSFVGFDGENAIELARCYVQKNLDKAIDYIKSRRDKCKKKSKAVRKEDGSLKYWKPSRRWKQFNRVLNKLYAKRREQMKLFAYTIAHWLERHYDKVLYGDYTPWASGLKNTHRSMLSQGYVGYLRRIVKWVFSKNGKVAEEVREYKSTCRCHCCGNEILMPPEKRCFVCSREECNASLPRDVNSAINLYNWHHSSEKKIPDAKINLHLKWSPFFGLVKRAVALPRLESIPSID
jgi:putative transposase